MRVCHLSSVHHGLDVRIFYKECLSLKKAGYDVHMVLSATVKDVKIAKISKIKIHRLKKPKKRLFRIICHSWAVFGKALKTKAKIYHFHDPELIPYGMLLAIMGKKVIYDVHEDVPGDILQKNWIPAIFRFFIAKVLYYLEIFGARFFFHTIAATPFIRAKFNAEKFNVVDIKNYPLLTEFSVQKNKISKESAVCYVGDISPDRGIFEILEAIEKTNCVSKLYLVGRFYDMRFEKKIKSMPGWRKVKALGYIDRPSVGGILQKTKAGLVTLHPELNHVNSLPIKMFEYMYAGLPVIASNFPAWRKIIKKENCGLLVDPLDSYAIAMAIESIVRDPKNAKIMGENAKRAIQKSYNWQKEEQNLKKFYKKILEDN